MMLYSCNHMATVGVKGLISVRLISTTRSSSTAAAAAAATTPGDVAVYTSGSLIITTQPQRPRRHIDNDYLKLIYSRLVPLTLNGQSVGPLPLPKPAVPAQPCGLRDPPVGGLGSARNEVNRIRMTEEVQHAPSAAVQLLNQRKSSSRTPS